MQIKFDGTIKVIDGDEQWKKTFHKAITITSKEIKTFAISASQEQIVWSPTADSTEATSNADFIFILADGACELELDTDVDADVGREQLVVTLIDGMPFVLGSDDSYAGVSSFDGFGGTADVIDRITAKAGSSAVNLIVVTGT